MSQCSHSALAHQAYFKGAHRPPKRRPAASRATLLGAFGGFGCRTSLQDSRSMSCEREQHPAKPAAPSTGRACGAHSRLRIEHTASLEPMRPRAARQLAYKAVARQCR